MPSDILIGPATGWLRVLSYVHPGEFLGGPAEPFVTLTNKALSSDGSVGFGRTSDDNWWNGQPLEAFDDSSGLYCVAYSTLPESAVSLPVASNGELYLISIAGRIPVRITFNLHLYEISTTAETDTPYDITLNTFDSWVYVCALDDGDPDHIITVEDFKITWPVV